MAKKEGKEVRQAFDGPDITEDELLGRIEQWNREDRDRASSAGETRADIGEFVERTGINPKALSMLRTIKKAAARDGGQAKALDIIRSLKKGLPIVEADISGNSTPDMFDGHGEDSCEPTEDIDAQVRAAFGEGDSDGPFDDDFAEEQAALERSLEEGTVVPFQGAAE